MQLISALTREEALGIQGLLFDLDDTFLTHGRITPSAFDMLFQLHRSGLELYAVTGRPAGLGRVVTQHWPIDGAVTENGAVLYLYRGGKVLEVDRLDAEMRTARMEELMGFVSKLRAEFPFLKPTDDNPLRKSDYTFDIGEYEQVPETEVQAVMSRIKAQGFSAIRSSVHLHVSLEGDDKASGALRLLALSRSWEPTFARFHFAFIGDSENDAACFSAFHTTIGVKNLRGRLTVPPRFSTRGAYSEGFTEAAQALLELKRAPANVGS